MQPNHRSSYTFTSEPRASATALRFVSYRGGRMGLFKKREDQP